MPPRAQRSTPRSVTAMILAAISALLFAAGFAFVGFFVWSASAGPHLRYLGAGFLTACAAFAVGALVGLIVGIPRFVSSGAMRQDIEARRQRATAVQAMSTTTQPPGTGAQPPGSGTQPPGSGAQPLGQTGAQPAAQGIGVLVARPPGAGAAQGPDAGQGADQGGGGERQDDSAPQAAATQAPPSSQLTPSTNLAEISDWLTKLLLGAGLVELTRLGHPLSALINSVARSMQNVAPGGKLAEGSTVVAGGILALYVVLGFIDSYIITTLWYGKYMEQFD
jgi:hypothetical protein